MKRHPVLRFAIVLFAMTLLSTAWAQSPEERATQVLDQLDAGQFEEVAATFDPQMQAALTAGSLEQVWTSLPQQVGALQSRGEPVATRQGEHQVVVIPLQFEHTAANFTVAFDAEDRLSSLLIQPAPGASPAAPAPEEASPEPEE